ncbi:toprim domain-containing protein [Mangrovibacillus cuniculi]|uniref:Toprim domain-containing protein n=1 Tax=Mangrovibacillus cuniculi TaxID=2593652 RepID=A0A7S8CED0_9BACI|nr:toprim domain-containing protein [Mangrovibacillus cuniculi]QPC48438.1 hypothetical protein G8O30_10825 [Mangrovibacillus cuniculi]
MEMAKVLIVEGSSDRKKVKKIISEPVEILCTNGTIGVQKMDEIVDEYFDRDVFVLADADDAGDRLRSLFKKEFPEARHLFIDRAYREVAAAPDQHIAAVLLHANIDVHKEFLA